MATANASVVSVKNIVPQDLFTITLVNDTEGSAGVPQYNSVSGNAVVTFDTTVDQTGGDIVFSISTFQLSGASALTYQLSAYVAIGGAYDTTDLPTYSWIDYDSGEQIGPSVPVGTPLTTTYTNSTDGTVSVAVQVSNSKGRAWSYPNQIVNATASVVEVSGYTVA